MNLFTRDTNTVLNHLIEPKIKPLSLGLISDPPTLVLIYEVTSDNLGKKVKRRKRKMPLRNFTDRSKVKEYMFALKQRHTELAHVLPVTVQKMLRVIQEILKGIAIEEAVAKVNQEYEIGDEEDLNKLTTDELDHKKAIMDEDFRKHLVKPGDPGYVYNKIVRFEVDKQEPSAWDEDSDNEDVHEKGDANPQEIATEVITTSPDFKIKTLDPVESCGHPTDSVEMQANQTHDDAIKEDKNTMSKLLQDKEEEVHLASFTDIVNQDSDETNKIQLQINPTTVDIKTDITELKKSCSDSEGLDQMIEIESGNIESDEDDFWT